MEGKLVELVSKGLRGSNITETQSLCLCLLNVMVPLPQFSCYRLSSCGEDMCVKFQPFILDSKFVERELFFLT